MSSNGRWYVSLNQDYWDELIARGLIELGVVLSISSRLGLTSGWPEAGYDALAALLFHLNLLCIPQTHWRPRLTSYQASVPVISPSEGISVVTTIELGPQAR